MFLYMSMYITLLVGGLNPPEKYESVGNTTPNIWENKKCLKPPASILFKDMDIHRNMISLILGWIILFKILYIYVIYIYIIF